MKAKIPKEIKDIGEALKKARFKAYLVGGCVRDILFAQMGGSRINADLDADKRGKFLGPKDWDIATDAKPEEIQKIFLDSVYENTFGTVAVKIDSENPSLRIVEITTFRLEGRYTDKRHPDEIKFAKTIEEDLSRRDFTINAMALDLTDNQQQAANNSSNLLAVSGKPELIDPYDGQKDLKEKLIRAVGEPGERFNEDALRLMRAVRLATQLNFKLEEKTEKAIKKNRGLLEFIAKERIRDEFIKLIMSKEAHKGIFLMQKLGLLKYIIPELEEGVGVGQNKHHIFTVFEHNVKSLEYAASKIFPLDVRVASLLHDVGKPKTKKGNGPNSTFYGHQVVGERMALRILDRLRFPKKMIEKIALLVREHMFIYDPETVTLAGVRRLLKRVGKENIDDLFKVREADRIGSGVPKAQPYRLRHLKAMVEKVQKNPISPSMLKIKGDAVMEILKIPPGPRVGKVLAVLLEEILDDPKGNIENNLKKRVRELGKLSIKELDALSEKAKRKAAKTQERIDEEIKRKYFVR